jgi:AhpD family alkylhydroperoxidase
MTKTEMAPRMHLTPRTIDVLSAGHKHFRVPEVRNLRPSASEMRTPNSGHSRKQQNKLRNMHQKENLSKLKQMNELAPEVMKAFWAFDKAAVAEGAIPVKYKELIAVAVALTTQCPYCIDIHSGNARKAGATDAEMTEAAMVAAALRAGGAVTHATHALLKEAQNAN